MIAFWWQGKGFITALVVVAAVIVTGMIADATHLAAYGSWFWAIVFLLAAGPNWIVGRRINEKRRKTLGLRSPLKQLA